jgi:polyhydroxyalkanoate synthase
LLRRYKEPSHAQEIHSFTTEDGWRLRLHRRKPEGEVGEPVFFMHSLSSNHLNFEIPYGHSLVDYLAKNGYDCWTFDSRACRGAVPPKRGARMKSTVEDLLTKDIPAALRHIRSTTGHARVHWVGHSMGGMLLYAYDLQYDGEGLASGSTLGSPPGFKGFRLKPRPTLIWLNRHAHRLMDRSFQALAPFFDFWRPVSSLVPINWDNVHPKLRAKHLFHAAEMPLPIIGEQMYGWASGKPWTMCDGTLEIDKRLHELKTPLLAIFGSLDPFNSLARANAFFNAIKNPDKKMIYLSRANGNSANYNHIDLAFAVEGEREVFRPILEWMQGHPAGPATRKPKAAAKPRASAKAAAKKPSTRIAAKKKPATRKK